MIYLLDADTLITGDRVYYPLERFPTFWEWLRFNGARSAIKVPIEQYDEVVAGKGTLVDWLKEPESKKALVLVEDADPGLVGKVTEGGYAKDLNDAEIETIGLDPFLIAYGLADPGGRSIISFEKSAPSKKRANRKVPDVCDHFGLKHGTLFDVIRLLDFTTDWKPPK